MNNEHHRKWSIERSADFHCTCLPLRRDPGFRLVDGTDRAAVSAKTLAHRLLG